ncbi:MAG: class I SAM-dependent methyltransferase [Bryobacteraceae bacterium]
MMNPAEFDNIVRTEAKFWWFVGMQRILFRLLEQEWGSDVPGRVLEAGCGTGYFATAFAKHFFTRVDASDLASEGLRFARKGGLKRLVQADVRSLPFETASYGCVLSLDVLVHLEPGQERSAFVEFSRVLAPGGLLVLRVSALDILRSRHSAFTHERQRFTRERLVRLAQAHGLQVVRCTYLNSLLMPVALVKFWLWEPLQKGEPTSGLQPVPAALNALLGLALKAESAWLQRGWGFPAGQSLLLFARKV